MGLTNSKSPLQRRNTVARRSQRKSIHTIKSKIESIQKEIRKFSGVREDEKFVDLKNKIARCKIDLTRKEAYLQPQVKGIYAVVLKNIEDADEALSMKLKENQRQVQEKPVEAPKKEEEPTDGFEIEEVNDEAEPLDESKLQSPRNTVELKMVQFANAEVHHEDESNSPRPSRSSIIKMGVAVMPGAMNEINMQSHRIAKNYQQQYHTNEQPENVIAKINDTIEMLHQIELEISGFVGKKNGSHYNQIRDRLNMYLIELNQIESNDEDVVEQLKTCKNYVGSCLNFLDEKTANFKDDSDNDDVFENRYGHDQPENLTDAQMHQLMKTTSI